MINPDNDKDDQVGMFGKNQGTDMPENKFSYVKNHMTKKVESQMEGIG